MADLKRKRIDTFTKRVNAYDWDACLLPEFLARIDKIIEHVPAADRANIMVDWTGGGYEDECGRIDFTGFRYETDDEMASRIAREKYEVERKRKAIEDQERATYEALKRKFDTEVSK